MTPWVVGASRIFVILNRDGSDHELCRRLRRAGTGEQAECYWRAARKAGKIWREHGALAYVECLADDVKPGKVTSFPQSVKLKQDEVVVFAWIVYKSRAQRDRVNAKVMKDPRMAEMMDPKTMPFDGKRMFWGGFKVAVEL